MPRDEAWKEGVKILVEELKHSDVERAKQWEEMVR
jgi:hypothetical protein